MSMVVLVGVVVDMVLPIREPNVGGIPFKHQVPNSQVGQGWLWYTANHYALPMCQAIPTETETSVSVLFWNSSLSVSNIESFK